MGRGELAILGETVWGLDEKIDLGEGGESLSDVRVGDATIEIRVQGELPGVPTPSYVHASNAGRQALVELEGDGTATLHGVLPGACTLALRTTEPGDDLPFARRIDVPEDGDPPAVEIDLDRLGVLEVLAGDGEGRPLVGAAATAYDSEQVAHPLHRVHRGERAAHLVSMLEPGAYLVVVQGEGVEPRTLEAVVRAGEVRRVVVGE